MDDCEVTHLPVSRLAPDEPESISAPSSIQSYGVLLAFCPSDLVLLQVSRNVQEVLGHSPDALLGQPLDTLLGRSQAQIIRHQLAAMASTDRPESVARDPHFLKLVVTAGSTQRHFDSLLHRMNEVAVLELESTKSGGEVSFSNVRTRLAGAISRLQQAPGLGDCLHQLAAEIRAIAAYDRVMVYQFDHWGAGEVVAEAKREELAPYLGLHYPASDVPLVARELYARCTVRFIPDVGAPPIPLVIGLQGEAAVESPDHLDLSFAMLRSVDPCFVEYLQNMGVAATLVISLVRDGTLWGLVACHHQTPKFLPYEARVLCQFIGQVAASELGNKIDTADLDYRIALKSLQAEFLQVISRSDRFPEALVDSPQHLLGLANASGAAIRLGEEIAVIGQTPTVEELRDLLHWADTHLEDNLFWTDALPSLYPTAAAFQDRGCGLLLLKISEIRRYTLVWFRPEAIRTVNWAGNPHEGVTEASNGQPPLSPRRSFELWQETVRGTALPWQPCELEGVRELRSAIVGSILNKADQLARMNRELERSNQELSSFAYAASHDLKEPLRGIHNYALFLQEDYAELLDEAGIERLQTLVRLSQRMDGLIDVLLRFSQIGQLQLDRQTVDLNELLSRAVEVIRASRPDGPIDIRVPRALPTIACDPVLADEVFRNLLSNAFKYNTSSDPWVEVGYLSADEQLAQGLTQLHELTHAPVAMYIRDNGIGIRDRHREVIFRLFKRLHAQSNFGGGTGAGLTIAKKIVERHGGRIWVDSIPGKGSTFYFTLQGIPGTL